MSRTTDELISDYLKQLEAELSALPRAARQEVVEEISTHIAEARAGLRDESPAEILELLDRLGAPAEIAAEAWERFGLKPRKRTWVEIATLVLLPVGAVIIPVLGWFIGVILLWVSDAWNTRDKLLGTFVVPGGLALPFVLTETAGSGETCLSSFDNGGQLISRTCSGGPSDFARVFWPTFVIALAVATLATTIYLAVRSGRARAAAA